VLLLSRWASSPTNWFMGEPFGASFLRLIEGSEVTAEPHNFYIEMLLRTGCTGPSSAARFDNWTAGGDMAHLPPEYAGVFGSVCSRLCS
jgi:hypothetical protein